MKNSKSIFFNIIAFFIFIVIMVVFVLCKDSTNKITSPFLENGYYIQVESKKYELNTMGDKGQILLKNNKEIANITYITQSYVNKHVKTLKKSKNIDILSEVYSDKNNGYCFFKNKNTNTYYYLLVYPHSAVLLQSNLSKKETRKILQKISIVECNEANDSVIPIVFPIDS